MPPPGTAASRSASAPRHSIAGYLIQALSGLVDAIKPLRAVSPLYHANGTLPINTGFPVWHHLLLAAVCAALRRPRRPALRPPRRRLVACMTDDSRESSLRPCRIGRTLVHAVVVTGTIVVGVDESDERTTKPCRWAAQRRRRYGDADVVAVLAWGFLDQHSDVLEGFNPNYTDADADAALERMISAALSTGRGRAASHGGWCATFPARALHGRSLLKARCSSSVPEAWEGSTAC